MITIIKPKQNIDQTKILNFMNVFEIVQTQVYSWSHIFQVAPYYFLNRKNYKNVIFKNRGVARGGGQKFQQQKISSKF